MDQRNLKQVETMLAMQASFNAKVMPNWKKDRPAFADAIWTESAEAFNHTNWEWWKNQASDVDYGQLNMEVIDIWHFLMSELMLHEEVEGVTYLGLIQTVYDEVKAVDLGFGIDAVRRALRTLVGASIMPADDQRIIMILASFMRLIKVMNMSWDTLYKLYVGKNALNQFRQNNGYKTDTKAYKHKWASKKGWEDNQYLTEYLTSLDSIPEDPNEFREQILGALQALYDSENDAQADKNQS